MSKRIVIDVVIMLIVFAALGGIYYVYIINQERNELRDQVNGLEKELEAEKRKKSAAIEQSISSSRDTNQPTASDRIRVKELCESKYSKIEQKLIELALSPGFEDVKNYYENQCALGSSFDRLDNPYYCINKQLYVSTRETYVPYCEAYYLPE